MEVQCLKLRGGYIFREARQGIVRGGAGEPVDASSKEET